MTGFLVDGDVWLMLIGVAGIAWSVWPAWRRAYRRRQRHQVWLRTPLA